MRKFEVFYTYVVDASVIVEAEDEDEAKKGVEQTWKHGMEEKWLETTDFEVLYVRKR